MTDFSTTPYGTTSSSSRDDLLNAFMPSTEGYLGWLNDHRKSMVGLNTNTQSVSTAPGVRPNNAAAMVGYTNLLTNLLREGKQDPAILNRTLNASDLDTEAGVQANDRSAASRGFQNSGVTAAINSATRSAGASRGADIRLRDQAEAEARKRADLEQFRSLSVQPAIDYTAIHEGQYGRDAAKSAANQQSYATLISGLLALL